MISTHSPREGRSEEYRTKSSQKSDFNSLAPRGAIRGCFCFQIGFQFISTHSPREGRSRLKQARLSGVQDFNSLAPRGAIPDIRGHFVIHPQFQLTRPARGDPEDGVVIRDVWKISTHSPREGRSVL